MYDLFVIGAGPGGYTAAILAAKKGLKVGIAEGSQFGGTCTNTGCIPTKTYIESVNLHSKMQTAKRFGIDSDTPSLQISSLVKRKDRIVTRLSKGIEYLLHKNGVDIYKGVAEVLEKGYIRVNEQTIHTAATIIATGSRPKKPPIFHVPGIWTSEDIFRVSILPESLAIIGGGVVGMEMAHIFHRLGSDVTIIEALQRVLPFEEEDVSEYLAKVYRNVRMMTSSHITGIKGEGPYTINLESQKVQERLNPQRILLCIGREPVIPQGLQEMGITFSDNGGIAVDESMQTSIPGVYAIGDITGKHMYAYVASREAGVAVDHLTGGQKKMDYHNIPSIIFTDPEVASVGKNPDELNRNDLTEGIFPVSALGRARTMEANDGYARIYCSRSGMIERITIISPHATELISWAALAVDQGLTVEEFLRPYSPHPTLSELLREASEDACGMSVHKP